MDWDKANFKKINQRRAESKRWEKREADATKRGSTKAATANRRKRRNAASNRPLIQVVTVTIPQLSALHSSTFLAVDIGVSAAYSPRIPSTILRMKFDRKAIALNVLTLGFTGAKASNQTIKRIKEKRSIPVLPQIALFLYLVPIYGWISFFVGFAALLGYQPIPELVEDFGDNPGFVVSGVFFTFSLMHLVLGTAILQHLKEQKEGHRAKIIWFGCYGLKWNPIEHLKEDNLEP